MIGEQYAGTARARRRTHKRWQWPSTEAIAGRKRVALALGDSVLVQLLLAMSFVAMALLLYLAQASQADVLQLTISELQQDHAVLIARNASLHASATQLQSLRRIDAAATGQLHMTKPNLATTLWVRPVLPTLAATPQLTSTQVAQQQSEPLAELQRAWSNFLASL